MTDWTRERNKQNKKAGKKMVVEPGLASCRAMQVDSPDAFRVFLTISRARVTQFEHASSWTWTQRNLPPTLSAALDFCPVEPDAYRGWPLDATDLFHLPSSSTTFHPLSFFCPFSLPIFFFLLLLLLFFFLLVVVIIIIIIRLIILVIRVCRPEQLHIRDAQTAF
ncbi:hypothetical protein BGW80DRAFT_260037 [Lactifluus volemus]|nr:hypothetical protein BGW80DRAFT_260037 [Lactifluus volemus]